MVPQLVPPQHLLRFNGINGSIQSGMMLLAPAAAGAVYAFASIVAIFFIDVITAIVGIGMFSRWPCRPSARPSTPATSPTWSRASSTPFTHRFVRWLLILFAIVFVLTVAPSYLTPLMLVREFGDEVWMLTVLEITFSVGMLVGGFVIAAWGGPKNKVLMIAIASLAFGGLLDRPRLSPNVWVFFGFMLIVGLTVPFFSTPSMTLLQLRVEPEKQGRVFGFVGIVMAVAMPLGMVIFGPLADQIPGAVGHRRRGHTHVHRRRASRWRSRLAARRSARAKSRRPASPRRS